VVNEGKNAKKLNNGWEHVLTQSTISSDKETFIDFMIVKSPSLHIMFGVSDVNDWRDKKTFHSYGHYYAIDGQVHNGIGSSVHGRAFKVGDVVRVICNRSAGTIEWRIKDEKLGGTFNCEKLKNKENDVRFSVTMLHEGHEVQILG
jgi:hypothetical protein